MKYFKLTDLTTKEECYISSTLPNETPAHVAMTLHLDNEEYKIEEVSTEEFYRETEDEHDPIGMLSECGDDWDLEEADEYF